MEQFLADLRALRARHSGLTFEALEKRASARGVPVSKSSLNNAVKAGAIALPSERVLRALVLALTSSPEEAEQWAARRSALGGTTGRADSIGGQHGRLNRTWGRSRRRVLSTVALLILTNTVTGCLVFMFTRTVDASPAGRAQVITGDDPGKTACLADARVATSVRSDAGFLLEVIYSAQCDAAWGRITREDSSGVGNSVRVSIYRRSDPHGPDRQSADEPDAYTTLIVRDDPVDRLCVDGSITGTHSAHTPVGPICI